MIVRQEYPRSIRQIENTWIPLSDGVRLAARIWLPVDAEQDPVPAILEYIPYRKDDATAAGDALTHPYFAGHGYACLRVDLRGSGDSDGILMDEYLVQEQDDALEVLAWIAAQPWCTGSVGIIGISWGGFNGLQIAARRPPQLRAVISLCSTDDRYNDDCHYMGGCLLGSDMLDWASYMLAFNARPPDPHFVGERWRQMWLDRLEHTPPFIEAWLSHQRQDSFWQHGSVREDYGAIACPVYMVGGWADPYTNSIPRVLAGLSSPRKGLIGPWAHTWPHTGFPGPAIGFLQECLRWWDHWLKGIDTGIMAEPMLRVWMLDSVEPVTHQAVWPGHWVSEPAWPPQGTAEQVYAINDRFLAEKAEPARQLTLLGSQANGLNSGIWCPISTATDFPAEQRLDDGFSLTFDSSPVSEPMEILGFPELTLDLAADQPAALLAARLCDVAPSGASTLVSWGLLNLTHRDGHQDLIPVEPGQHCVVTLRLNAAGYALAPGHRWRLALSPTYWPHAWPSPHPVTLTLTTGVASRLVLPVRQPRREDAGLAPFGPPECAEPLPVEILRSPSAHRTLHHDVASGGWQIEVYHDDGRQRLSGDGLVYESISATTYAISEDDPLSAHMLCWHTECIGRDDWQTRIETESTMTGDAGCFRVTNRIEAYEGRVRVFARTSSFAAPRDLN